jgi:hypothetical protein
MAVVVVFRWRTSTLAPPEQWKRGTEEWASGTVDTLRRPIGLSCGSSADLAADVDPELWLCDESETPTERVNAPDALEWTPATCPRLLFERHPSGRRKAVLLFTFPPSPPPPAFGTGRRKQSPSLMQLEHAPPTSPPQELRSSTRRTQPTLLARTPSPRPMF